SRYGRRPSSTSPAPTTARWGSGSTGSASRDRSCRDGPAARVDACPRAPRGRPGRIAPASVHVPGGAPCDRAGAGGRPRPPADTGRRPPALLPALARRGRPVRPGAPLARPLPVPDRWAPLEPAPDLPAALDPVHAPPPPRRPRRLQPPGPPVLPRGRPRRLRPGPPARRLGRRGGGGRGRPRAAARAARPALRGPAGRLRR